jgi:hypothetical protein
MILQRAITMGYSLDYSLAVQLVGIGQVQTCIAKGSNTYMSFVYMFVYTPASQTYILQLSILFFHMLLTT